LVISADRLSGGTRTQRYLVIVFFAKREVILVTFPEAEDVAVGVDGGSLTQQS